MVEKKATKKVAKKSTKKATKKAAVTKTAKPSMAKQKNDSQMISHDKATEMYAKRNKASGLDKELHPLALWGFICAVAPFVGWAIPFLNILIVFFGPPVGIILSAIGLNKVKNDPKRYKGRGLALAGIIVGAAVIVLGTIGIIAVVMYVASADPSLLMM